MGDDEDGPVAGPETLSRPSRTTLALRVLLTVLVVAIVLSSVDLGVFTAPHVRLRSLHLVLALLLSPPFLLLKAYKWHLLARTEVEVSFRESLQAFLVGMSVGILTPGRVGEVARATRVQGKEGKAVLLVAVDKAMDLLVVVLAGLVFGAAVVPLPVVAVYLIVALLALALLARPGTLLARGAALLEMLPFIAGTELPHKLRQAGVAPSHGVLGRVLAITIVAYSVVMLQFHFLLLGFGAVLTPSQTLSVLPAIVLVKAVPLTIASLGVREGAAMVAFALFGVAPEVAVAAAFSSFVITTGAAALGGIWVVWRAPSAPEIK